MEQFGSSNYRYQNISTLRSADSAPYAESPHSAIVTGGKPSVTSIPVGCARQA